MNTRLMGLGSGCVVTIVFSVVIGLETSLCLCQKQPSYPCHLTALSQLLS